MPPNAPRYVGIDLGTTNSAAAVFDGEQVTPIRTSHGGALTPSVVRIDRKGRLTVGERARRFLDRDPANTRTGFKRLMGTEQALDFPASGDERRPEELAAEVLRSIRADCREQLGFEPERAVVSVPALFELPQSAATSEAARLAGFERVELIQEPVASALAAGWSADDDAGGAWLVYDIGGGTFDVSLLETRDGLLRVVGHDGDNFLGGRDIDRAIVDHALQRLADEGTPVERADPSHADALRRLQRAAEEVKIDLTRADEALLSLPELFEVGDTPVDVDLTLTRAQLDELVIPIVDRSIAVCGRLLTEHGLTPDQLLKVVLVGGPTVMPVLRERVRDALGAPFAEGLDPMTLVARGAALYAATAGLEAHAEEELAAPEGRRLWLQYPAMSSDLFPHAAGRLLDGDGPAPARVRFVRDHDDHPSEWADLDTEGGLVVMLELSPRRPNTFRVEGVDAEGRAVPVVPASIRIVQGLTITDPPLSRSVGVALASNVVQTYLQRGTPLPAKRTFVHKTVESVARGVTDSVLTIPIVQGELEQAHLCRLVGQLVIGGQALSGPLPSGSDVEVTLEVDRGGRLSARALVPSLDQVFEEVAHLVVPDARPDLLAEHVEVLQQRLGALRGQAMRHGDSGTQDKLYDVEWSLQDAVQAIEAARGGDDDAGQRARRLLLDADATLESLEGALSWPELEGQALMSVAFATRWVGQLGSAHEQKVLDDAVAGVERARSAKQPVELQRQLRVVNQLGSAAWYRHPEAWTHALESAAADVPTATDVPLATRLVAEGRQAARAGDRDRVKTIVQQLWTLLPHDARSRQLGHGSGLR